MASRALAARFIRICSICRGSTRTRPNAFAERESELDIFANQPGKSVGDARDHRIQIRDPQSLGLLAAEGEQLPGQLSRPARRKQDFLNLGFERTPCGTVSRASSA